VYKIWPHGESLRFATPKPTGITVWEVGSTPGAIPMEVETVLVPENTAETFVFKPRDQIDITSTEFHPASRRLAFTHIGAVRTLLVWDFRDSKFLLCHTDTEFYPRMTFSSDGHFFACTTKKSEVYLWKESPTGYILFGKLTPATPSSESCFSPNGEGVITFCGSKIQLWHARKFIPITSGVFTQGPQHISGDFILEFLPDRPLAAAIRKKDNVVTVFNLKSGVPQLTIDTSIEVYGLRLIENTVVVIGDGMVITWNIPRGDSFPNVRMNIEDSIQTINFSNVGSGTVVAASVSPDLQYIAIARNNKEESLLSVYCMSTKQTICREVGVHTLWFDPGGHNIWCAAENEANVFTIAQDTLLYTKTATDIEDEPWKCPWGSSCGYKVTYDGWILGVYGKRMLMLPPLWQSQSKVNRVWNGELLALLHSSLPEPVILELIE